MLGAPRHSGAGLGVAFDHGMQTIRLVVALAFVTVAAGCATGNRIDQTLPASIDPARIDVLEVVNNSGEVLLRGAINGAEASADSIRRGELTGPSGGAGRGDATIRGNEILVDLDGLPPLAFMALRANGEQAIFFRTSASGGAQIKLERTMLARAAGK